MSRAGREGMPFRGMAGNIYRPGSGESACRNRSPRPLSMKYGMLFSTFENRWPAVFLECLERVAPGYGMAEGKYV